MVQKYGRDSVRNFIIGEIPFGGDGPYTQELFLNSFNTNLANTVGNLASRTAGMIIKYNGGVSVSGCPYGIATAIDIKREWRRLE